MEELANQKSQKDHITYNEDVPSPCKLSISPEPHPLSETVTPVSFIM